MRVESTPRESVEYVEKLEIWRFARTIHNVVFANFIGDSTTCVELYELEAGKHHPDSFSISIARIGSLFAVTAQSFSQIKYQEPIILLDT